MRDVISVAVALAAMYHMGVRVERERWIQRWKEGKQ